MPLFSTATERDDAFAKYHRKSRFSLSFRQVRRWLARWSLVFLLILYLLPLVLSFVTSELDYALVDGGWQPVFSRRVAMRTDGGSIRYQGLGYTLWAKHEIAGRGQIYEIGPQISYHSDELWPWARWLRQDKENLRVVTSD
jgi:hypothetical protein